MYHQISAQQLAVFSSLLLLTTFISYILQDQVLINHVQGWYGLAAFQERMINFIICINLKNLNIYNNMHVMLFRCTMYLWRFSEFRRPRLIGRAHAWYARGLRFKSWLSRCCTYFIKKEKGWWMAGWRDRQTDGWRMDGWTDRRTRGRTDWWMEGIMDGWNHELMDV